METGENGQHGVLAVKLAELALSQGAVSATTQLHQMEALTVLEVHLNLRHVTLRPVQVNF